MMVHILNINTALEHASVCISTGRQVIAEKTSSEQKEHASFLQPAIKELTRLSGIQLKELSAIAVVIGPGSYTGLRVGLSGAKGICYALNLPLITINTLEWMAAYFQGKESAMLCPAIDARRNEIFTALYEPDGREVKPPFAHILTEQSFEEELREKEMHFFGNGASKCSGAIHHPNARFTFSNPAGNQELVNIAMQKWDGGVFSGMAYAEPLYVKEFYSTKIHVKV